MSEYTTQPIATKRLERPPRPVASSAASPSGLARYFDLSPAFFRLGFIVLTLLGGSGVLLYLAALLIIPEEGKESSIAAEAIERRRDQPWRASSALGLAGVAIAVLTQPRVVLAGGGAGWVLILLAGLVILWTYDARRGDRRSRRLLKTCSCLTFGFDRARPRGTRHRARVVPRASRRRRRHPRRDTDRGHDLQPSYHLGVGDLRLDLMQLPLVTQETHVKVRVDVGNLRVLVTAEPAGRRACAREGRRRRVFQEEESGRNVDLQSGSRRAA